MAKQIRIMMNYAEDGSSLQLFILLLDKTEIKKEEGMQMNHID